MLGIRKYSFRLRIWLRGAVILTYGSGSKRPINYGSGRIQILHEHFCARWKKINYGTSGPVSGSATLRYRSSPCLLLRLSMSRPTKSLRSKGAQRRGTRSTPSRLHSTRLDSRIQNSEPMKSWSRSRDLSPLFWRRGKLGSSYVVEPVNKIL